MLGHSFDRVVVGPGDYLRGEPAAPRLVPVEREPGVRCLGMSPRPRRASAPRQLRARAAGSSFGWAAEVTGLPDDGSSSGTWCRRVSSVAPLAAWERASGLTLPPAGADQEAATACFSEHPRAARLVLTPKAVLLAGYGQAEPAHVREVDLVTYAMRPEGAQSRRWPRMLCWGGRCVVDDGHGRRLGRRLGRLLRLRRQQRVGARRRCHTAGSAPLAPRQSSWLDGVEGALVGVGTRAADGTMTPPAARCSYVRDPDQLAGSHAPTTSVGPQREGDRRPVQRTDSARPARSGP